MKLWIVWALAFVGCHHEHTVERGTPSLEPVVATRSSSPEQSDRSSQNADSGRDVMKKHSEPSQAEASAPYPTEYVDQMLERTFGDAARHTPEHLKLIGFVEKSLSEADRAAFPEPHRYLVRREDQIWIVSVMSLDALRTPGLRAGELLVYVRQLPTGFVIEKTRIRT